MSFADAWATYYKNDLIERLQKLDDEDLDLDSCCDEVVHENPEDGPMSLDMLGMSMRDFM
jgi:hypothetical protein